MITVASWNVLHRVHAENYDDPAVARWPDEALRIAAVTAKLAGLDEDVIALQEVSGDQLASVRAAALPGRTIHAMRYPRVPAVRQGERKLRDLDEYLVLIVRGDAEPVAAEAFDGDPGKGLLAVRTAAVLVVCTHVGFGDRRDGELVRLAEVARGTTGTAILLGDFNADAATVARGLGAGFAVAGLPAGALPTRPGTVSHIDHVVVRNATVHDARVEDAGGLSDHNVLAAAVRR